jgi:ubiquinone biosynthesis protein UbiJ
MPSPLTSWLGPAVLTRLVLLLNHVVASEPQASARLRVHVGRTIELRFTAPPAPPWLPMLSGLLPSSFAPAVVRLLVTPAGLFEHASGGHAGDAPGLTLSVRLSGPLSMLHRGLRGERPDVQIEGDVALAETASWLMNHLRWDVEDDVARWLGHAPAELLRQLGNQLRQALLHFKSR